MIKDTSDKCMKIIDQSSVTNLIHVIDSMPKDMKITDLQDSDGYSLLHMAVFNNKHKIFDAVL